MDIVYQADKAWLLDMATHRSVERLAMVFYRLPFEPYARFADKCSTFCGP